MALRNYNPTTPGQRGLVIVDKKLLWRGKPEKGLSYGLKKTGGRNAQGVITAFHRGGGNKRVYREILFNMRGVWNKKGIVQRIEYDPNRSAFIALVVYDLAEKHYILAPEGLNEGDSVEAGDTADIKNGNTLQLKSIPVGSIVHNVELKRGKGGQIARTAGASVQIIGRDLGFVILKLSSGEIRKFHGDCLATIGALSNADRKNVKLGKAGRRRWLGWRPHVRGVAMNPIDHPHGGGEGRTSGGRHPVSRTGVLAKGKKTRSPKKNNIMIIKKRGKK